MRAVWTGAITFGLVNVPVKLYSATQDHDVSLHQVHDADGGRIRYQRRCEVCSKVVEYAHIDKAYDFVKETVAHGGTILFVGTKKQAQGVIAEQATRVGQPYVKE